MLRFEEKVWTRAFAQQSAEMQDGHPKNVGGTLIPAYYMQSCMLAFLQVRIHRYIAIPSIPIEFCLILRLPGLPEEVSEIALEALAQAVADGAAELHVLQSCLEFGILKP